MTSYAIWTMIIMFAMVAISFGQSETDTPMPSRATGPVMIIDAPDFDCGGFETTLVPFECLQSFETESFMKTHLLPKHGPFDSHGAASNCTEADRAPDYDWSTERFSDRSFVCQKILELRAAIDCTNRLEADEHASQFPGESLSLRSDAQSFRTAFLDLLSTEASPPSVQWDGSAVTAGQWLTGVEAAISRYQADRADTSAESSQVAPLVLGVSGLTERGEVLHTLHLDLEQSAAGVENSVHVAQPDIDRAVR